MKLELDDIRSRVTRTEDENRTWCKQADQWEAMWKGDAGFKKDAKEAVLQEGREQVITPDPYNAVNLAMRLIPSQPKIDVPPRDETDQSDKDAQQVERWLTAMYPRIDAQQGDGVIERHKWQLFTFGKSALQSLWIRDDLPEKLQKKNLPFLVRTLDPRNVGVKRGPYYAEYAYHKYEDEKINVRQQYPNLAKWDKPKPTNPLESEANTVTVTDFWYRVKSGAIWHAVIVDDEFALEPREVDYPDIPIIVVDGDYDGMSLLHPMNGLWQYKCRLTSSLGTAVLWYTHPFFAIETPMGHALGDWEVRPLATQHVVEGTKIQEVRPQPNANLIEQTLQKVETSLQQSTFPGVLYGDAGNMQAGYGVNILSQAATGRVQAVRDALEWSLMELNSLVLMLIDAFDDDDEGVELWGRNERDNKLYKTCLYKDQIAGYYENSVQFKVSTPQDDIAMMTLGIRLLDSGYLSVQTFWDKWLKLTVPEDERMRIMSDQAMKHPDVQKQLAVSYLIRTHPETWEALVAGTELEAIAQKVVGQVTGIPQPPSPMQGPPPGMMPPEPPPVQPPQITPMPMGGGMPAELAGQLQGEDLGMDPAMNPAMFAELMGQPLPPTDELDVLGGSPPPMI